MGRGPFCFFWRDRRDHFRRDARGSTYEEERAKARAEKLKTAQEEWNKTSSSYGWVDKEKGVARIPIERAMELELADLQSKKPAPAGPIATPAPAEAPAPSTGAPQPRNFAKPGVRASVAGAEFSTAASRFAGGDPATTTDCAPALPVETVETGRANLAESTKTVTNELFRFSCQTEALRPERDRDFRSMRSRSVERRIWSCRDSAGSEVQPRLTQGEKVRRRRIPRPYPNVHEHARRINSRSRR